MDDRSFEEVALPHLDAVYRFARRLCRDEHEAEDIVQETFLKAHKAFGSFELRDYGIKPWLLKILHNTFLNHRSREKRQPTPTDQQAFEQMREASEESIIGTFELDFERLDEEVKQAVDHLSEDFRSVVLLWATMEFSYQEIAEILGVPVGTVMSRLHRARQQLMRILTDYAQENRLLRHRAELE